MTSKQQLESLLKLLRKHGVKSFKTPAIELELDDLPSPIPNYNGITSDLPEALNPKEEKNPFEGLSEEDILNWSSQGT